MRLTIPLVAALLATVSCADMRSVTTSWGVVRGEVVSPGADDLPPVAQYLGVPYGVAPSGQYRFNMAISAAKWTHLPKDARAQPAVCIQTDMPELSETKAFRYTSAQHFDLLHRLLPRLKRQSEDCLHMNLFVPERLDPSSSSPLPVLVLVHGSEYGWGAGTAYNGSVLAAHSQVIVVALNYRLGVFGFLGRCDGVSCQGNSGISDLVSALAMLQGILPAFGGDPKSVTVMGWGSGASLVSLLMASPLTQPNKRLFRRAILLDGTALSPWAMSANPQQHFMQLVDALGCASRNKTGTFNEGVEYWVRCMQDHSAENVTKAMQSISVPTFLSAFAPIVDGQLIPNRPRVSFSSQYGSLFREIDLMVGTVSNPAHHLLSNDDLKNGISKERREKIFRTLIRNLYEYHRSELLAAVSNEYTDWENPTNHPKSLRNGVLAALSDVLFVSPLIETLRMHAGEDARREANTFLFVFGHETRSWQTEQPNSGIRGALSGDHLPYILGYPLTRGDREDKLYSGFSADDRGLSRVMMQYVGNFVKSGDPSKPSPISAQSPMEERFHSVAWPQFDQPGRESYLDITDRPRVKNYYRNAQVGFWTGLVPKLQATGSESATVPLEHHLLPDHFRHDSFFGKVRPFSPLPSQPFPPPPLPPTPPPQGLKKPSTTKPPLPPPTDSTPAATAVQSGGYSTMLSVTVSSYSFHSSLWLAEIQEELFQVAVGCSLLFLNICVFFGLYRQCDKNKKSKKKLQLQYQTYASGHASGGDMNYNINSPMPPPPPQIGQHPSIASTGNQSLMLNDDFYFPMGGACGSLPRNSVHEQEPLLASSSSHKPPPLRPGVSPTCPRHGRSAITSAMMHSRGNSLASSAAAPPTLEEIQV